MAEAAIELAPQAANRNFQDLSQNSQAARWFGYLTTDSLDEVMHRGYFDPCARWEFRIFDRIDVTCDMDSEKPTHTVLLVAQPSFESANDLHVETVRWL